MRETRTRDHATKGFILAALLTIAFVVIACSNTEKSASPMATSAGGAGPAATSSVEGKDVAFFGDDGKFVKLMETADGKSWTEATSESGLHVVHDVPADLAFDSQEDGTRKATFVDENGSHAVVELKGDAAFSWTEAEKSEATLHTEGDE